MEIQIVKGQYYEVNLYHEANGSKFYKPRDIIRKLEISLSEDEFYEVIKLNNGGLDLYGDICFKNIIDAEKFKEWLEQYLIIFELTK